MRKYIKKVPPPIEVITERVKEIYRFRCIPQRICRIIEEICCAENINPYFILTDCRLKNFVRCRKKIYLILRSELDKNDVSKHSYTTIGRWFDKDHTTIMYEVNAESKKRQLRQLSAYRKKIREKEKEELHV